MSAPTVGSPTNVQARSERAEKFFFALLLIIHLTPICFFQYFPTQDGPNHVDNATLLDNYHEPNRHLLEYYSPNFRLVPNWLTNIILVGLMQFVSVLTAEKILIASYVVLLPVSVRYALSAIRAQGSMSFSIFAFPFIYNDFLHRGFYNFIFSIPLFFFVIGYWLRHHEKPNVRQVFGLAVLVVILFFSHIVGLMCLVITLFILTISVIRISLPNAWRDYGGLNYIWRSFRSPLWIPLLGLVPALTLALMFFIRQGGYPPSWAAYPWQLLIWPLYGFIATVNNPANLLASMGVVGLLIVGLYFAIRNGIQRTKWNGLIYAAGVLMVLYFVAPYSSSGATIINPRFVPFILLLSVLWLGAQNVSNRARINLTTGAAAFAILILALNFPVYARINTDAKEYLSGMKVIEPGSTLFSFCLSTEGCGVARKRGYLRISPFEQLSGYISAQRNLVNLNLIDPHTDYFPIRYRHDLNAFRYLNSNQIEGKRVWGGNMPNYSRETGGRIDYVLVWHISDALESGEDTTSLLRWLSDEYDLVFTSPQRGMLQIYRRKGFSAVTPVGHRSDR